MNRGTEQTSRNLECCESAGCRRYTARACESRVKDARDFHLTYATLQQGKHALVIFSRCRVDSSHEGVKPLNRPELNDKAVISAQKRMRQMLYAQSGFREDGIELMSNITQRSANRRGIPQLHARLDNVCKEHQPENNVLDIKMRT